MSQLSAWAARQQEAEAMKPATLVAENGALLARVMAPDTVHLCSPYLKEIDALRLGRWLVATCGEEPTRYSPDEFPDLDWRAAVREWAEKCRVAFPCGDHVASDKGWNEALAYLIERLPTIQPRRPSGRAAREEEG